MQARFIHDGKAIDFLSENAVPAGTVVVALDLVKLDIPAGQLGALHVVGVYDVVKDAASIPLGSKVYWDNVAKKAVVTATNNKPLGIAVQAATAEDSTVRVLL